MSDKPPRKRRPVGPIIARKKRKKIRSDKEKVRDELWKEYHSAKDHYEKIAKQLLSKDQKITRELSDKLAANASASYKNHPDYYYEERAKGYISVSEKIFLDTYSVNLDIKEGLSAAGWVNKSKGIRILAKETSQQYLKARMTKLKTQTLVDEKRVIKGLLLEAEDKENGSPGSRVQAWTQLGRHLAMFTDKQEIDNKVSIETIIADLPSIEDQSGNVIDVDFEKLEEKDVV